jgi:hypothetical protein
MTRNKYADSDTLYPTRIAETNELCLHEGARYKPMCDFLSCNTALVTCPTTFHM